MIEEMSYIKIIAHKDHIDQAVSYMLDYDIHINEKPRDTNFFENRLHILEKFITERTTKTMQLSRALEIAEDLVTIEPPPIKANNTDDSSSQEFPHGGLGLDRFSFLQYTAGHLLQSTQDKLLPILEKEGALVIQGKLNYIICIMIEPDKEKILDILKSHNFVEQSLVPAEPPILLEDVNVTQDGINQAYATIHLHYKRQDIINHMTDIGQSFFMYRGFMPKSQALVLAKDCKHNPKIIFTFEPADPQKDTPPTRLKNHPLFAPYQILVKAYSLPKYTEIDPTPLLAIVYTLLFGMMFGDVGQGAIICAIGLSLKPPLKNMAVMIGLSSVFFGFMYGSVLGFEHILPPLWLAPSHHINTIIIASVAIGSVLVGIGMVVNIIGHLRRNEVYKALWGQNALSGLLFYVGAIGISTRAVLGQNILEGAGVLLILLLLPLALSFIYKLLSHPKDFFTNTIHGFETLLSYATNTLSFIRVGAIILSHSAMMGAVFLLSSNLSLGGSILAVGVGNAIVMAVEILVVSIQALRLHYYEIFSRFYEGNGKEFKALRD